MKAVYFKIVTNYTCNSIKLLIFVPIGQFWLSRIKEIIRQHNACLYQDISGEDSEPYRDYLTVHMKPLLTYIGNDVNEEDRLELLELVENLYRMATYDPRDKDLQKEKLDLIRQIRAIP